MDTPWMLPLAPAPEPGSAGERTQEAKQEARRRKTHTASEESGAVRSRNSGRCALAGRALRSDCRHHVRTRVRQRAAGAGSPVPAFRLAGFVALSFFMLFYAQRCRRKGLSRSSSRPSSLHFAPARSDVAVPFPKSSYHAARLSGERRPTRRLASENFLHSSSSAGDRGGAAEDALCSAIEASAQARRAVAATTRVEESDDEPELNPSTHKPSMEKRERPAT